MKRKTQDNEMEPFPYRDFDQAFKALKKAFTRGPAYALLSGESGTGKTTLLRTLAASLDRRRFHVLYLCHGKPTPSALARVLAEHLHLPVRRTRAETGRMLVHNIQNLPKHLICYLDEAQQIPDDTFHELRLLAEADLEAPLLFSVVLSGLGELKDRLQAPSLFPLLRRITLKLTLDGLTREEVRSYLLHRFGKKKTARFSDEGLALLFEQARGIPALVEGYAATCLNGGKEGPIEAERVADTLDGLE